MRAGHERNEAAHSRATRRHYEFKTKNHAHNSWQRCAEFIGNHEALFMEEGLKSRQAQRGTLQGRIMLSSSCSPFAAGLGRDF